ncbi:MAG: mannose-1-phosphate guanylyltransferase [Phycisphaerales bacterium]|jgi:mannose-1-phosphate guanylyltransferase
MRYAMIMAGGAGTRLWPVSRQGQPKQLVRFIRRPEHAEPMSLLEIAAERLEGLVDPDRRYICTGERYRAEIEAALPAFAGSHLLGEPEGRDTLNAVGFAAAVFAKEDPDAVFAVLTADHLIEPQEKFVRAFEAGFDLVEQDPTRLITFGITPTFPATGFGYIEQGPKIAGTGGLAFRVNRFVEKPALPKAQAFVDSGNFLWNAGMFIFHAGTFMKQLAKNHPETAAALQQIADAWGTPDQEKVLNELYPTLKKTSVDYGVMEPASNADDVSIVGVTLDVKWLDVGSWPSYGETVPADSDGNRVSGCAFESLNSHDNLVISEGTDDPNHRVSLIGCDDLIIVRTPNATLVMPKDKAQDLKELHGKLPEAER